MGKEHLAQVEKGIEWAVSGIGHACIWGIGEGMAGESEMVCRVLDA